VQRDFRAFFQAQRDVGTIFSATWFSLMLTARRDFRSFLQRNVMLAHFSAQRGVRVIFQRSCDFTSLLSAQRDVRAFFQRNIISGYLFSAQPDVRPLFFGAT
jgi:hypothetical protein